MTDATDLLEALVAIAKDPKAWDKRVVDMRAAAGDLNEARALKKDTEAAAAQAAKDVETAHYERDQIERTRRELTGQAVSNSQREKELDKRESELNAAKSEYEQTKNNWTINVNAREADLATREAAVAKKLKDAETLLAKYDEAKHQAALKLAS
jgi:DNA repair exonuclease SbcCD ATPase subunit